eukprot:1800497-Rhodomonas_salina.1
MNLNDTTYPSWHCQKSAEEFGLWLAGHVTLVLVVPAGFRQLLRALPGTATVRSQGSGTGSCGTRRL